MTEVCHKHLPSFKVNASKTSTCILNTYFDYHYFSTNQISSIVLPLYCPSLWHSDLCLRLYLTPSLSFLFYHLHLVPESLIDVTPPIFDAPCPLVVLDLVPDTCGQGHIVDYKPPTATDNSGTVNVTGGEGDTLGSIWPFGVYERYFTARDPSGNTAGCLLIINILRKSDLQTFHPCISCQEI